MNYKWRFTLLVTICLLSCGRSPQESLPTAIIDHVSLELVPDKDATKMPYAAMGSIQKVFSNPDENNALFAIPYCSAFRIASDLVLTAAHCAKDQIVFNPLHLARGNLSRPNEIHIIPVAGIMRLNFVGEQVPDKDKFVRQELVMARPVLINMEYDFVVYHLPKELEGPFIDIKSAAESSAMARVIGYPNGIPLSVSNGCAISSKVSAMFRYDCSAMNGSSGGLVVTPDGQPLALHQKGPGNNLQSFYESNKKFESSKDFAVRAGCDQADHQCINLHGFNRGLSLKQISAMLEVAGVLH